MENSQHTGSGIFFLLALSFLCHPIFAWWNMVGWVGGCVFAQICVHVSQWKRFSGGRSNENRHEQKKAGWKKSIAKTASKVIIKYW